MKSTATKKMRRNADGKDYPMMKSCQLRRGTLKTGIGTQILASKSGEAILLE